MKEVKSITFFRGEAVNHFEKGAKLRIDDKETKTIVERMQVDEKLRKVVISYSDKKATTYIGVPFIYTI